MNETNNGSSANPVVMGPSSGSNLGSVTARTKEPWNIFYSKPLRAFGGGLQVSITGKGERSFVNATANWRGREEIGFYDLRLPEDRCDAVRSLVERSDFAHHAHRGNIAPETPHTLLGYNPSGEANELQMFVSQPPPQVAKAMNAVEDLGEEIRKHPYMVIAGSAAWNQPRLSVGDTLDLTVTLRSVGEKAVTIDNPLGSTNPEWTGLRMVVAAAKPDDKLDWANEVAHVDIARQDLLTTERRLPKAEPRIELAPGKELQFIVRRKFHMSPGFYKAIVTYHGVDNGPTMIGGVLDMELGRLEVVP